MMEIEDTKDKPGDDLVVTATVDHDSSETHDADSKRLESENVLTEATLRKLAHGLITMANQLNQTTIQLIDRAAQNARANAKTAQVKPSTRSSAHKLSEDEPPLN